MGTINIEWNQPCNGLALWVDWHLDDSPKGTVSTGPTEPIVVGKKIQWDMYTRQGVCLFPNKAVQSLQYKFSFDFKDGNISFKCS